MWHCIVTLGAAVTGRIENYSDDQGQILLWEWGNIGQQYQWYGSAFYCVT